MPTVVHYQAMLGLAALQQAMQVHSSDIGTIVGLARAEALYRASVASALPADASVASALPADAEVCPNRLLAKELSP